MVGKGKWVLNKSNVRYNFVEYEFRWVSRSLLHLGRKNNNLIYFGSSRKIIKLHTNDLNSYPIDIPLNQSLNPYQY